MNFINFDPLSLIKLTVFDWRNNLFSANHRNAMIERYNYTDAMIVTVEELMSQAEARSLSAMKKI